MRRFSAHAVIPTAAAVPAAARFLKLYTDTHVWVDVVGSVATIGLAKGAAERLVFDEIRSVRFVAEEEAEVVSHDALAEVNSASMGAVIRSPITGTLKSFNPDLTHAALAYEPEGRGWICKINLDAAAESCLPHGLMDEAAYARFIEHGDTDLRKQTGVCAFFRDIFG